jgi:hypothetical protein
MQSIALQFHQPTAFSNLPYGFPHDNPNSRYLLLGAAARKVQDTVDWLGRQWSTSEMVLAIADGQTLFEASGLPRTRIFPFSDDASLRQTHAPLAQTTDAILAASRIVELDLPAQFDFALDAPDFAVN